MLASRQGFFFAHCRTGNISIAVSGMQILFYTQPCDTPALARGQFARRSLLCLSPRTRRRENTQGQELGASPRIRTAAIQVRWNFKMTQSFVVADFLIVPWTETCASHCRRGLLRCARFSCSLRAAPSSKNSQRVTLQKCAAKSESNKGRAPQNAMCNKCAHSEPCD